MEKLSNGKWKVKEEHIQKERWRSRAKKRFRPLMEKREKYFVFFREERYLVQTMAKPSAFGNV